MKILNVTITVQDLDAAAGFYRDTLGVPVTQNHREAVVQIGSSQLILRPGSHFEGAHHLAFGIPPADFALARKWLAEVVEPIKVGDTEVIDGPEGWDSQSVYFLGPENAVLELIARQADSNLPASAGDKPQLVSISEVGIGVPDVPAAVKQVVDDLGVKPFSTQEQRFTPVGDHQGLLILVEQDRTWFPTQNLQAAQGSMTVLINTTPSTEGNTGGAPTHVLKYDHTASPHISIDAVAESKKSFDQWGYIYLGAGTEDPATDRAVIESGGLKTTIVAVPKPEDVVATAVELVDAGAQTIEMCGAFGAFWVAEVLKATQGRVPVGVGSFGMESVPTLAKMFA